MKYMKTPAVYPMFAMCPSTQTWVSVQENLMQRFTLP